MHHCGGFCVFVEVLVNLLRLCVSLWRILCICGSFSEFVGFVCHCGGISCICGGYFCLVRDFVCMCGGF